jgi:hypothetical protein
MDLLSVLNFCGSTSLILLYLSYLVPTYFKTLTDQRFIIMNMKRDLFKTGIILLVGVLICSGCNQRPKVKENSQVNSKGQTATVEVEIFDAVKLKDQIVEIITTAPTAAKMAENIDKLQVSYMPELTLSPGNVEKYNTAVEQSLAVGIYKMDMFYAQAYKRNDVVVQLMAVREKLLSKIGLEGDLASLKRYNARINQNKENTDSLNKIIPALMNELAQNYSTSEHSGVYAMAYVGANIEGLYFVTQVALMAKDNSSLLKLIDKQKERVKSTTQLLEIMSVDPLVNPYYEKMKPIMDYFSSSQEFTTKQLNEVAPLIENLRKEIIK